VKHGASGEVEKPMMNMAKNSIEESPKTESFLSGNHRLPVKTNPPWWKRAAAGLYIGIHILICLSAGSVIVTWIKPQNGPMILESPLPRNPSPFFPSTGTTVLNSSSTISPTPSETPYIPPTATPILTTVPLSTYILPPGRSAISGGNLSDIRPIARLGKGWVEGIIWTRDGNIILLTSIGITFLDATSLRETRFIGLNTETSSGALAHNGKTFAVGLRDGRVQLRAASDGKLIAEYSEQKERIFSVLFSPDDTILAAASAAEDITLFRVSSGEVLQTIGIPWSVRKIAFSANGDEVLTASYEGVITAFQTADGRQLHSFSGFSEKAAIFAFSADGSMLAFGGDYLRIEIIDTSSGEPIQTLKGHFESVSDLAFSPDDSKLVSCSADHRVKVWDIRGGNLLQTMEHTYMVDHIAISGDGTQIASWEFYGPIKFWRFLDGALLNTTDVHSTISNLLIFSKDNSLLIAEGGFGVLKYWNPTDGTVLGEIRATCFGPNCVALSPDGSSLATSDGLRRLSDGEYIWRKGLSLDCIAFSPDGRWISVGGSGKIYILNAADGTSQQVLEGHANAVVSVAFSPDSQLLVSGSKDKTVKIWRVADGALLHTMQGHLDEVRRVEFSPDGKMVASAALFDQTVRLWRVSDGSPYGVFPSAHGINPDFAFSPDGSLIALAGRAGVVEIWRLSDRARVAGLTGHNGDIAGLEFAPDGSLLASGSNDGSIIIWGVAA
jgi:WD40 repeat protein